MKIVGYDRCSRRARREERGAFCPPPNPFCPSGFYSKEDLEEGALRISLAISLNISHAISLAI